MAVASHPAPPWDHLETEASDAEGATHFGFLCFATFLIGLSGFGLFIFGIPFSMEMHDVRELLVVWADNGSFPYYGQVKGLVEGIYVDSAVTTALLPFLYFPMLALATENMDAIFPKKPSSSHSTPRASPRPQELKSAVYYLNAFFTLLSLIAFFSRLTLYLRWTSLLPTSSEQCRNATSWKLTKGGPFEQSMFTVLANLPMSRATPAESCLGWKGNGEALLAFTILLGIFSGMFFMIQLFDAEFALSQRRKKSRAHAAANGTQMNDLA